MSSLEGVLAVFVLISFIVGILLGSFLRGRCLRIVYQITEENVGRWLRAMDEKERSVILYPLVKSAYNGRRTIHRCPTRKGKTANMLDKI